MVTINKILKLILFVLIVGLLSGCMYNNNTSNSTNPAVVKDSLTLVQAAVDSYRTATGVLPIKNFDSSTSTYEQYVIDFKKIIDRGFLGEIPSNSFEKGGANYYVLIDAEEKPQVKLLDLLSLQQLNDLQSQIDTYRLNNRGLIPSKSIYQSGWFYIDYEKLKIDKPVILSPYSKQPTEILVALDGQLVLDYAADISKAMKLLAVNNPPADIDLRTYLVQASYYVPGRSAAYYWNNNQPQIAEP